jgi:DNA-directed RNA polymerase specialized sigma24 family protein
MDHYQLVKDCLKGEAAAQKRLYELFASSMLGICYRYTKSMTDAEDVLQEICINSILQANWVAGSGALW